MFVFGTVAVLLTVIFILGLSSERNRQLNFQKTDPPLTDDEFVKRCGARTNPEIALKVRDIISLQLGIAREHIYPEHRFVEDLHAD